MDDFIVGTSDGDQLFGGSGDDVVFGRDGGDFLDGGSNNDSLEGGSGNDTLTGDIGNDTLVGGLGVDTLTGGSGSDFFRFNFRNEGVDRITDFSSAADTIQVDDSGFGAGLRQGVAITTDQFFLGSSAGDGEDRFIYNRSIGSLFFDSDGRGGTGQTLLATLTDNPVFNRSDIVVV